MLSIGLPAPDIPPVPGQLDGPIAGGIGTHGRFEGEISDMDLQLGSDESYR